MAKKEVKLSYDEFQELFRDSETPSSTDIWEIDLAAALKKDGFASTYKALKKGTIPRTGMMTVEDGVVERLTSGLYEIALQTEDGPLLLTDARQLNHHSADPQFTAPSVSEPDDKDPAQTVGELLEQLSSAGESLPCSLLCQIELTRFDSSQKKVLLPLLWKYITLHRNSNVRDELVAVGAAIRKYIAIMPMDRMGELAVLLESGHKSQLPIELEIEVAKMIYRNYEVHPPTVENPQPELAQQLLEMVKAYANPRNLLRDKHAAVASLAIEAIVSMRSPLAEQAWQAANECGYRWFAELVSDDIDELLDQWNNSNNPNATSWLRDLRNECCETTIA